MQEMSGDMRNKAILKMVMNDAYSTGCDFKEES